MSTFARSRPISSLLRRGCLVWLALAGASLTAAVSVRDHGARGDGRTDDTRAIQAALNTGGKVIIPEGIYLLTNCLEPAANQEIELIGTLKIADAHVQPIAADVPAGQPRIQVADARGFRVGQWVALGDETLPIQRGGRGVMKTRREGGDCGRIIAIEGDVLVLGGNLRRAYRRADQARVATQPSAILIEDKSNIHLRGTGTIDANKAGQFNFAPAMLDQVAEETRAGCGITVHSNRPGSVRHVTLAGITVRDAILHNLSFRGVQDGAITGVTATGAHDKNILLIGSERCRIQGNTCLNSQWEDGIIAYTGNRHCLIQGNVSAGNHRFGICVNAFQEGISLVGNLCADNGLNLRFRADHSSSTGDICTGKGDVELMGRGNVITGLISRGTVRISATDFLLTDGVIGSAGDDALEVGMVIRRDNPDRRVAPVENVRIEGVLFVGCKTGVRVGGVVADVQLRENRFRGATRPIEIAAECRDHVRLARNDGYPTESRGTAQLAAAARSVRVSHGLALAPQLADIVVTPANSLGESRKFWIARPTATDFEILVDAAPGPGGAEFVWQVK